MLVVVFGAEGIGFDVDPAGADAVDADGAEACGECVGECDEGAFAGGVAFGVGFAHAGSGGGDEDDGGAGLAACGFAQHGFGGAGQEEGGGEVGGEDAVPVGEGECGEGFADHDAGIADECVETAFPGLDIGDRCCDLRLVGDVGLEHADAGDGWRGEIEADDLPIVVDQALCCRATDPVGRSGYQCHALFHALAAFGAVAM